jgi:hypothetical protein
MSIVLIGSTSGSCTLQEQAVAGTTVLTLPTTSGTVLTSASSASSIPGNGSLTQSDLWYLTTNFSQPGSNTESFFTTNLTRTSISAISGIGSGMTEASGVFTFPATGQYFVISNISGNATNTSSRYIANNIYYTVNNGSSYSSSGTYSSLWYGNAVYFQCYNTLIFNVTDTAQCKVKFSVVSESAFTVSSYSTYFQFIRLGNTP